MRGMDTANSSSLQGSGFWNEERLGQTGQMADHELGDPVSVHAAGLLASVVPSTPTGHVQNLAGHVTAGLAYEEFHHRSHLFGTADPA